jgi:hypothetical protein
MLARNSPRKAEKNHRERRRRTLYKAVDRIIDGVGSPVSDEWVIQVLEDLGGFVRAASSALYYEAGRVISGVDRPLGSFPLSSDGPSWQGAALEVDGETADKWVAAGEAALSDRKYTPQFAELVQRTLFALLYPIANMSHHAWLMDLALALRALPLAEVHPLLERSSKALRPYRRGMTGWSRKLAALAWAEFQIAANIKTREGAFWDVAEAFGLKEGSSSVQDWRQTAEKHLGREVAREKLEIARIDGRFYRSLSEQIANDQISTSNADHYSEYVEDVWGPERLKQIGRAFRAIPKKAEARKKKKKVRGETGSP